MKFLALITARGGSKRLPNKNVRELCGKPLIAYTVEAAHNSRYRDEMDLICSTDDPIIALIAEECGCAVPFMRPDELAEDNVASIDAVEHAVRHMEAKRENRYEYVILLQPTSPLRTARHLDEAITLALEQKCDSVIAAVKPEVSSRFLRKVNAQGYLENTETADLSEAVALNGAIYITKRDVIMRDKNFYGKTSLPYMMDKEVSVDIDTQADWELAKSSLTKILSQPRANR